MADMMDTLKGLLGDDADEKISGIMSILNPQNDSENADSSQSEPDLSSETAENNFTITPEMLKTVQALMGSMANAGNDSRTNLLMSLKPYVKDKRRDSIDNAIKMLNMAQFSQIFKEVF